MANNFKISTTPSTRRRERRSQLAPYYRIRPSKKVVVGCFPTADCYTEVAEELQNQSRFFELFPVPEIAKVLQNPCVNVPAELSDAETTDAETTDAEPTDDEPTDAEPTDAEPTDDEPTDDEPTDDEPVVSNPRLIASGLFGIPELAGIPMDLLDEICAESLPFGFEDDEEDDANAPQVDDGWNELFEMAEAWGATASF